MERFTIHEHGQKPRRVTAQSHLRAAEIYARRKYGKRYPLHNVERWSGEAKQDGYFHPFINQNGQRVGLGLHFYVRREAAS